MENFILITDTHTHTHRDTHTTSLTFMGTISREIKKGWGGNEIQ